jgi:hypothetical protein
VSDLQVDERKLIRDQGTGAAARTVGTALMVIAGVGFFALFTWDSWISAWISIFAQILAVPGILAGLVFTILGFTRRRPLESSYCLIGTILFAIAAMLLARAAHSELAI